jgi:uncharacterized protein (TIGR00290 family)
MKKRTLLSWSSGKDIAWSLYVLRQQSDIDVVGLFSTVNQEAERVAMHAVRSELVQQQADSVGLPIQFIPIPYPCSNAEYDNIMAAFIAQVKEQGIDCIAFGDLYLEDIRKYREKNLEGTGITPIFPLWGKDTEMLSKEMVKHGLRAIVTCIDPRIMPSALAGKEYNTSFLELIPDNVDPCGENGEFHSFAFDGPMFKSAVNIVVGETVSRDGLLFTDLLPGRNRTTACS